MDIKRMKRRQQERAIEKVQREKDLAELNKYMVLPAPPKGFRAKATYDPTLPIINITDTPRIFEDASINEWQLFEKYDIAIPFDNFHLYWKFIDGAPFLIEIFGKLAGLPFVKSDSFEQAQIAPLEYKKGDTLQYICMLWHWAKSPYDFLPFKIFYRENEDGTCIYEGMSIAEASIEMSMYEVLVEKIVSSLGYLNLSNVEIVDEPPATGLAEIHKREFGKPITIYKVAKVDTSKREYQGRDKDTGLKDFDPRRMHVVRGHHAEYGTNGRKLLFGKYAKKIWIPAHVRGNEELGIVVKDYEVVNHAN